MANPARDLSGILTGSGYTAYIDKCRKDDVEAYDALCEAAETVYRGIIRAGGGAAWAMGFDTKVIARRIKRAMMHSADLHLESAKALGTAAAIYNATLGSPPSARTDSRTFDPSK